MPSSTTDTTTSSDLTLQRIQNYLGAAIDPNADADIVEALRQKFSIYLPQRQSLDDALAATISDHEVVELILQYRAQNQ